MLYARQNCVHLNLSLFCVMIADQPLSAADIEHFIEYGFVVVREAMSKDVCDAAVKDAFERVGYDRHDPSTWVEKKIHLGTSRTQEVKDIAPKAWAATCQLLGGEERVRQPYHFSNAYIMNLGVGADEPHRPPSPDCPGWHKDGDFFRHFLDSPEQGLLTIVAWSDVVEQGGATYIATDSVSIVARHLAKHPEGLLPNEIGTGQLIHQCLRFAEATARAGDVYLLHPYMLHCHSQNTKQVERIIINPPAMLKEPMNFNRPDGDYSPVEQAVLRALDVDHYDFQRTGEREALVPESRKKQQQRMLEEEARRRARESTADQ